MKRRRHTPEQVIRELREADKLLGERKTVPQVARAWRSARVRITAGATTSTAG